jgi:hypothetical protein
MSEQPFVRDTLLATFLQRSCERCTLHVAELRCDKCNRWICIFCEASLPATDPRSVLVLCCDCISEDP